MRLHELEELFERLTDDLMGCGDVEYILIIQLRREVWAYMEAIKNAGQDAVSSKGLTGLRQKHIRRDVS